MRGMSRRAAVLAWGFAFGCVGASPGTPADSQALAHPHEFLRPTPALVLTNGRVLLAAEPGMAPRFAEALLLEAGFIAAVGSNAEIESLAARRVREDPGVVLARRDLGGGFVTPGLTDAHAHLVGLGFGLARVTLQGTRSAEEVLDRVATAARTAPPGTWIRGRGWDQNDWPTKAFPTRQMLDRVCPDHPVWLGRVDGHAAWANSQALARAGVNARTLDPAGGRILRDGAGDPTGVLVDRAMQLIEREIPPPTADEIERAILRAAAHCASVGLTAIHDAGIDSETVAIYRRLESMQRLPLRVFAMLEAGEAERADRLVSAADTTGRAMFRIIGVKAYADGALGSRGAALLAPYTDEPGTSGLVITPLERLTELARICLAEQLQLSTHAIGDRANRMTLDAYANAANAANAARGAAPGDRLLAGRRFRIEHAQVIALEDIPRFGSLGVIASVQPTHCTSDMPWAPDRLGPARIEGAYAWRRLLDAGARLCLGSDFPVEDANPLLGIHAAVTTEEENGKPPGGYRPTERLTVLEALRGFTSDAAYAAFAEDELGRIAPGMRADLSVFDRDLTAIPAAEIPRARCMMTIVAGRIEHEATLNYPSSIE